MATECTHLNHVHRVSARTPEGCEECLAAGTPWVHLRMCLECGHVGCCDQSLMKHATKHFHATKHPVMRSFQPDEDWGWCYIDEMFIEPAPRPVSQS
ncbi:MAG: UBP-type zinc finger domain-containing protein [bacterium]